MTTTSTDQHEVIGRYLLHRQIARGGMATIHIARLMGDEGFSRIVAAKRLHPEFAQDGEFVAMFLDEARVASKVHHHNVVPVLDVVTTGAETMLVQEYVHGVPLSWLLRTAHEAKLHVPIEVAVAIACQVLAGLHAAHETVDEMGMALAIVHRDVSPQNIMVATDGAARLLDFGVAKAAMSAHITRDGMFKGKLAYSAPEQVRGHATQQSDLYALSVVLWELLVGQRLHRGAGGEAQLIHEILTGALPTITGELAPERPWLGEDRWQQLVALEPIVRRGLALNASARWSNAEDFGAALAAAVSPASATEVASWLKALGKEFLDDREQLIAEEEASWRKSAATLAGSAASPLTEPYQMPRAKTEWPHPIAKAVVGGLGAACVAIIALIVHVARGEPSDAAAASAAQPPAVAAHVTTTTSPPTPPTTTPTTSRVSSGAMTSPTTVTSRGSSRTTASHVSSPAATGSSTTATPGTSASTSSADASATLPLPVVVISSASPKPLVAHPQPTRARVARIVHPTSAPPIASTAAPSPSDDCTTPYYFEGAKKRFKPACL